MPLDPDKLRQDVEVLSAERDQSSGSRGRPRSGAMSAIRQHLTAITALRDDGATWPDIAAALATQGIVQGDGTPLTGRHLTALIASIRRQDAGRAAARARRAVRVDLRQVSSMTSAAVASQQATPIGEAYVDFQAQDPMQGSPDALFHRLDQKARQAAEAATERPDFSGGLIKRS